MREPSRVKPFALMFTFSRINGKLDWSKEVLVRVYQYKPRHKGVSEHWEVCERGRLTPHGTYFNSMEEAVINYSILGIDLYKIKENAKKFFYAPRNVYWTEDIENFVSPSTILRRLEKIRGR